MTILPKARQTACLQLACALLAGCAVAPHPAPLQRHEFSRPEMGMPFRMVVYAADPLTAETAAFAAFARVRELNDIFTDYDLDSELSRLSRSSGQGIAVPVSDDLWHVLTAAQTLAEQTDGAFDITVGPYVNIWRRARRERALPPPERLARAHASVGHRFMHLDPHHRTVELLAPDMRLDLGGIAKGYAIQQAIHTLRQHGIQSALVTGGGDMAMSDPPPDRSHWRIEVGKLEIEDAPPPRHVLLQNRALATSGDMFQYLEIDGIRYSHIIDPRTGLGLINQSHVTVIAADAMTADSLATAASVLNLEQAIALIEQTPDAEARILQPTNQTVAVSETSGFHRYLEKP